MSAKEEQITENTLTLTALLVRAKAEATTRVKSTDRGGKYGQLYQKYFEKLEEYRLKLLDIKKQIREDKIEKWESNAEICDFFAEYNKLLKLVNQDCICELANSSKVGKLY